MTSPMCMLTIYLSHIASFLSSNFTLAYTSHRLIAVFFPMKATTFLKQRTNRILAMTLLVFACSFYSLSFPVTTTKFRANSTRLVNCEEDRDKPLLLPFLILDTLFTFIIPFTLISCMNLAIVCKLHTNATYKFKSSASTTSTSVISPSVKSSSNSSGTSPVEATSLPPSNDGNGKNTPSSAGNPQRRQDRSSLYPRSLQRLKEARNSRPSLPVPSPRPAPLQHESTCIRIRSTHCRATSSAKTTKMLLAASTVFLVFNLPYHLLLFCFLLKQTQPEWMFTAVHIARLWFFASFCVNFFVYTICGRRFRTEVVRLFRCSSVRRYFALRNQKQLVYDRHNSLYLSNRLLPTASINLSQSN